MSSNLKQKALLFAKEKHKGQKRKGTNPAPYINHPIAVAEYIKHYVKEDNEKLICVAYLHDTLEDTNTTYEELVKYFTEDIAKTILELTNDKHLVKKYGKSNYLAQKLITISSDALTVKLCDRLSNVHDSITTNYLFRQKYTKETIHIINYLINNRKINTVQLNIVNDILKTIDNVIKATPEIIIDINEIKQLAA